MIEINDIIYPIEQSKINYYLEKKREIECYLMQFQIQRFIFDIETMYLKIQNLGSFTYNLLPNPRDNELMFSPIDIFHYTNLYFDLKMYKNNGKEKDHPDDIRELKNSLGNIIPSQEVKRSLNLFGNIKRKDRFDVYNNIAELYGIPEFKKVISLFKNENSIYDLKCEKIKIKKISLEIDGKIKEIDLPECRDYSTAGIKYEIAINDINEIYQDLLKKLEKITVTKLGCDLIYYIKVFEHAPAPIIKYEYEKNENNLPVKRNVIIQGIEKDNEVFNKIKENLDILQETKGFEYNIRNLNFNKKNIKQSLLNLLTMVMEKAELNNFDEIFNFANNYAHIQKEKNKIMSMLDKEEPVKSYKKRM